MFNPEREVPNLELCKKLKELGFPQDGGGFYWVIENINGKELPRVVYESDIDNGEFGTKFVVEIIKAPTIRELGEWFPLTDEVLSCRFIDEWLLYWEKRHNPNVFYNSHGKIEAEARADLLVWLVENGYVNFKKGVKENEA